jgi:hypothetical protein
MIFKQQFTIEDDLVKGFAEFLGWTEKIQTETDGIDVVESENPETHIDFVNRLAKDNTLSFVTSWANNIKQKEIARQVEEFKNQIEPQIHAQVVQDIEDALTTEVIK